MTQAEYKKLQAQLTRYTKMQDKKMQAELKALLAKYARLAAEKSNFDAAGYASGVRAIYEKYRGLGAEAAAKIADKALDEMLANPVLRDSPIIHELEKRTFAPVSETIFVQNPVTKKNPSNK